METIFHSPTHTPRILRIALSFDAEHLEGVDDPSLEPVDDRIHGSFRCHAPMDDGIDDELAMAHATSIPTVRGDRIESVWWRRAILDLRAECQHFWMTHEKDCVRNSILDSKTLQTATSIRPRKRRRTLPSRRIEHSSTITCGPWTRNHPRHGRCREAVRTRPRRISHRVWAR